MKIDASKYISVLKFEKLIIPESIENESMEKGAFYSTLFESWMILRSELSYPKMNKSYFREFLTGSHYVACSKEEEQSLLFDRLSVHFNVKQNVPAKKGSGVIDFIIQPRKEAPLQPRSAFWRDPCIYLGITLKAFNKAALVSENDRAVKYIELVDTEWDNFGRVPIFVKSGIYDNLNRSREIYNIIDRLMKHRVGFINSSYAGFQFRLSNKTVWDPFYGVGDMGARSLMKPKQIAK